MKKKRVNISIIDNRKEYLNKLERMHPELKNLNMGLVRGKQLKSDERKVA